jgi:hypothetical protein
MLRLLRTSTQPQEAPSVTQRWVYGRGWHLVAPPQQVRVQEGAAWVDSPQLPERERPVTAAARAESVLSAEEPDVDFQGACGVAVRTTRLRTH